MNDKIKIVLVKILSLGFWINLPYKIRYKLIRFFHEKIIFGRFSKEDVFSSIWKNNYWGCDESLSGPGSTLEQTENLRREFPKMLNEFSVASIFDAPCGDMHWMQYILKSTDIYYIGGDIVSDLISENSKKLQTNKVRFLKFDITSQKFPDVDLWLSRAVFYHLSNKDIYLALERFVESNIRYIVTTNSVTEDSHINQDIITGDWRSLNLTLPPFNFPKSSLWVIDDYVPPHPPVTLNLWTREQIEGVMPNLRRLYK
jgi:hypothetical protein